MDKERYKKIFKKQNLNSTSCLGYSATIFMLSNFHILQAHIKVMQ